MKSQPCQPTAQGQLIRARARARLRKAGFPLQVSDADVLPETAKSGAASQCSREEIDKIVDEEFEQALKLVLSLISVQLRARREQLGLTQHEVGAKLKMSREAVAQFELKPPDWQPNPATLERFEQALGFKLSRAMCQ